MKIHEQPVDFRPRERLVKYGAVNLSEAELLAIIISSGIRGKNALEVAEDILNQYGNNVLNISIGDLTQIKGLGRAKAVKLKAAFEFGYRFAQRADTKIYVNTSRDAFLLLQDYLDKRQEYLLLLTLNGRNQLISKKVITVGTLDASLFHPREIYAESIVDRASKIIVAHNHPSGNLNPSSNDLVMTQKVFEAGEILGIPLVDSLIISTEGFTSIIQQLKDPNHNNIKNEAELI